MDISSQDHLTASHYAEQDKVRAPLPFLNPTRRHIPLPVADVKQTQTSATPAPLPAPEAYHVWRSRDNRKGRHAIAVPQKYAGGLKDGKVPRATNTLVESLKGVGKMFVLYPVWDVSYDVAILFTVGKSGGCNYS